MLSWQLGKQDSTQVLSFENLRLLLSQHAFIHAAWLSREGMPDPLDGRDILQEHLGNIKKAVFKFFFQLLTFGDSFTYFIYYSLPCSPQMKCLSFYSTPRKYSCPNKCSLCGLYKSLQLTSHFSGITLCNP